MARAKFKINRETHPFSLKRTFIHDLVGLLSGCEEVLDAGCGGLSPLRFLPHARLTGVDVYPANIEYAKTHHTHDAFEIADARNLGLRFGPDRFDACAAVDVIEHFTKSEGLAFLVDLERIAKKRVVVYTPNGFLGQSSREEGDHQDHMSGWTVGDMRALGYRVMGSGGFKFLRGKGHRLRYRPRALWAPVSWLSQKLWCRRHPAGAAAILCWKDRTGASVQNSNQDNQP